MATTSEYGLGPHTYPRGWFMIGESETLMQSPQSVRFFGRDMVLYRGESGRVVLLDAYCPHMGAHLGKNTTSYVVRDGHQVEGDSIRCPFHAWRFGPDGKVDDIPYFDGTPPEAACVRSWTVAERYGCIWTWHDAENGEPDYDLPVIAEWDDAAWVRWRIDSLGELPFHPQELVDNIADVRHLGPIHGSTVDYFENEFDGHIAIQRQGGGHRTLVDGAGGFSTDTWYTGPGILQCRMTGAFKTHMLICHTPVEDGVTRAWHALMVESKNTPVREPDIAAARAYQATSLAAFAQDFELWATKRAALKVLQIPADGPLGAARRWYKQFYNARADAKSLQDRVRGIHTVSGLPGAQRAAAAE